MTPLTLPERPRILVVALRRLGDVLLTTPLMRSLRVGFPGAKIDALVFPDTAAILAGNPDIDDVVAAPRSAPVMQTLALLRRIWRRYDLAISTQTGDRPTLLTWAAGRQRIGFAEERGISPLLKRKLLGRSLPASPGLHRVTEILRLADALGIARMGQVVCPAGGWSEFRPQDPYAVVHAGPMFHYKRWTTEGWRRLAATLHRRGLVLIATGGADEAERRYLDDVWGEMDVPVRRLDGALGWSELAAIIAGAQVYVGPDTSVTHLAAATGCPTVALYGPTDPRRWGPWPFAGLTEPWAKAGTIQQRGNVWLVQNPLPCLPCQEEGCERRLDSHSRCLDELPVRQVLAAVEEALAAGQAEAAGAPLCPPDRDTAIKANGMSAPRPS